MTTTKKKLKPIAPSTKAKAAPEPEQPAPEVVAKPEPVKAKAPAKAAPPKVAPAKAPEIAPVAKAAPRKEPEPGASKTRNAALKAWETRRLKAEERKRLSSGVTVNAPKASKAAAGYVVRKR
jgi:hypothetical protein